MNVLDALDESVFAISTYYGVMENKELWEAIVEDANISKDKELKRKVIELDKFHLATIEFLRTLISLDNQREILKKIPFINLINAKHLNWKSIGFRGANMAFRLLLELKKINDRPIYRQKIEFLKFLIDKNNE